MDRRTICMALSLFSACSPPEPAPDDIDGVLHFLWDGWESGDDDSLVDAVANLDQALLSEDEGLPFKGSQSRLVASQIAALPFTGGIPDPSLANGFFVATEMGCSFAEIDLVFSALNQDELHPGSYDFYERNYTSDESAYRAGDVDTLTWDVEIHASPAGFEYVEYIQGGSRRIAGTSESPILLGRTHLLEPATEDDENKSFTQDYQLDVYYERSSGELVHLWVVWRAIDMGTIGDQDSAALIAVTLSEGQKWDEVTTEACEALR